MIAKLIMPRLISVLLLTLCVSTLGANRYVLDGGSGDGSSWSSAYDVLPVSLTRGDTYYIGDGTYAGYSFDDADGALITIKKATAADHGTETGWSSTYGDGTAFFVGNSQITTDNWLIDGMTGGGPGSWTAGHGICFTNSHTGNLMELENASTNITLRHILFRYDTSETAGTAYDHLYGNSPIKNLTVQYCYFLYSSRTFVLSRYWEDVLVEYCRFEKNRSEASSHAEGWSDHGGTRYVIRHNQWVDVEGTGVYVLLNGVSDNVQFYGNVIWWTGNVTYDGPSNGGFTDGASSRYPRNWKIFNNTMWCNAPASAINYGHQLRNATNCLNYNNLFYGQTTGLGVVGNGFSESSDGNVSDYNVFIDCDDATTAGANDIDSPAGGDPFTNKASEDFTLVAATTAGIDTGASVAGNDVDMNGNTRGADGTWDRGAFEFDGTPTARRATLGRATLGRGTY